MVERIEELADGGDRPRVLVAGATGYTGALAARLVDRHPGLDLVGVTGRSKVGERLDRLYPRHPVRLEIEELDNQTIETADAGIVAYPHGASAPVVAEMRGLGLVVVDLSADFRFLDLPEYEKNYGGHGAPELLDGAVYACRNSIAMRSPPPNWSRTLAAIRPLRCWAWPLWSGPGWSKTW